MGTIAWMVFFAWPARTSSYGGFIGITSAAVVAAAVLVRRSGATIGIAGIVPPLALAPFTASAGDGTGLGGHMMMLLAIAGVEAAVGAGASLVRKRSTPPALPKAVAAAIGIAAVVLAVIVTIAQWPRPFGPLEEVLGRFNPPGFRLYDVTRKGSPLRTTGGATVTGHYFSELSRERACDVMRRELIDEGVTGVRRQIRPSGLGDDCVWVGKTEGGTFGWVWVRAGQELGAEPRDYFITVR